MFLVAADRVSFSSQTSEESNPLVDGTSEVLEREGVNKGIVRRKTVHFDPSSWIDHGLVQPSTYHISNGDVLLGDEDLDRPGQLG